jgi:hypothetical protein
MLTTLLKLTIYRANVKPFGPNDKGFCAMDDDLMDAANSQSVVVNWDRRIVPTPSAFAARAA